MGSVLLIGCAVCYGDPASPLSKGAVAGVIVLGAAILSMLVGFAGLFLFWMRRARALERAASAGVRTTLPSPTQPSANPAG